MIQQLYIRLHDGDVGECKDVSLHFTKYGVTLLDEDENEIFGIAFNAQENRMEAFRWDSKGRVDGSLFWKGDK